MKLTRLERARYGPRTAYYRTNALACDVPRCPTTTGKLDPLYSLYDQPATKGWLIIRASGPLSWELHFCPACEAAARDTLISAFPHAPANPPQVSP